MLRFLLSTFLITILVIIGCSSNPTTPDSTIPNEIPVCNSDTAGAHHSMGFYNLAFDTDAGTVDVVPVRVSDWHFNITGVLNATMGVTAAVVPGLSDPPNGLFVLDISLTHPFATKPQFAGFDVKGILIAPGSLSLGSWIFSNLDETCLENADGYTRWWNPTEFTAPGMLGYTDGSLAIGNTGLLTATVNPYKLFADILGPNDSLSWVTGAPLDDDNGRAVFTAGSTNTRRYYIRFQLDPGPQVIYGYAIDASWNPPSPNPPTEVPDNFPMNANQPESYRVVLGTLGSSLFYDTESATGGGVLKLMINVHDWQGQYSGDTVSEVGDVQVYMPETGSGPILADLLNFTPYKARYIVYSSVTPNAPGPTPVICSVESTDGSTYQQGGDPAPSDILSAFQVMSLDVIDPECTIDTNNTYLEAVDVDFGDCVSDQVCQPDDVHDYYRFLIPPDYEADGLIRLFCDADLTSITLRDSSYTSITGTNLSAGYGEINLDDISLLPGEYFLDIKTMSIAFPGVYLLDMDAVLVNVAPDNPVDVTPDDLFAHAAYAWTHDNYALLAGGYGLFVYDISDPINPQRVSGILTDCRYWDDADFIYPYCYFIAQSGCGVDPYIGMVDFSDINNPVYHTSLTGILDTPQAITMDSTHFCVATWDTVDSVVHFYDYQSNPTNPTFVTDYTAPDRIRCMDIIYPDTTDANLIITTYDNRLISYNIDDLASISLFGSLSFMGGGVNDIEVYDQYVFFTEKHPTLPDQSIILVADHEPTLHPSSSITLAGNGKCLSVIPDYAFIADGSNGLTVVDVSDPLNIAFETNVPIYGYTNFVFADGDQCLSIPADGGLIMFDISDATTPAFQSQLDVVNFPNAGIIKDNYLYVNDSGGGSYLVTLDISDPESPVIIDRDESPYNSFKADIFGDMLAMTSGNGWILWDITAPNNPSMLFAGPSPSGYIKDIALHEDACYLALSSSQVAAYSISIPATPVVTATIGTSAIPSDFEIIGDTLYCSSNDGLMYLSLTIPTNPSYGGLLPTADKGLGIACDSDWLYMSTDVGLDIFDISTPLTPLFVSSLPTTEFYCYHVDVSGQFLYMEGYSSHPNVIRVQPSASPEWYSYIHEDEYCGANEIILHEDYLFELTNRVRGIRIWDLY